MNECTADSVRAEIGALAPEFIELRRRLHEAPELSDAEEQTAASQGADMYWLLQNLRFLFKACIMSELGFGRAASSASRV